MRFYAVALAVTKLVHAALVLRSPLTLPVTTTGVLRRPKNADERAHNCDVVLRELNFAMPDVVCEGRR